MTIYNQKNIFIYFSSFIQNRTQNELKILRVCARSAYARGEKEFCLFAIGKRVLQFQFFVSTGYYGKNCS